MKTFIISLFLAISFSVCYSQSKAEIEQLKTINEKPAGDNYTFARTHKNMADKIFSSIFLFYKKYISSQDMSSCSFTPSCSSYALQAIKSQGLIPGVINFFDRFTRCNGLSPEAYEINFKIMLLADPVRDFSYKLTYDKE